MNLFKAGLWFIASMPATLLLANVPAGIVGGSSPNVTLTDNGSTVTLANGIVSIVFAPDDGGWIVDPRRGGEGRAKQNARKTR